MKYEFHVGDYVETKDGQIGYITTFIHSHDGESTILVKYKDGRTRGYQFHDEEPHRFFNRIGQYDFTKTEPKSIERLPVDLVARFEVPDGRYITTKTWDKDGKFVETSYSRELIDKINELVEVVNRLEEKVNGMA